MIPGLRRSAGGGRGYLLLYSWASLVAQLVKNHLQCRRFWFDSWVEKICWKKDKLPTPVFLGFPSVAQLVNSPAVRETCVRSLGWEDLMEKGKATYSLQYSGLENSMDYMGSQRVGHD